MPSTWKGKGMNKIICTIGKGIRWSLIPLGIVAVFVGICFGIGCVTGIDPIAVGLFMVLVGVPGLFFCLGSDVETWEASKAEIEREPPGHCFDEKVWQKACDHWDEVIQLVGFESVKIAYINGFYSGYKKRSTEVNND